MYDLNSLLYFTSSPYLTVSTSPVSNVDINTYEKVDNSSDSLNLFDTKNKISLYRPIAMIFACGTIKLGNVKILTNSSFFNPLENLIERVKVELQSVSYPTATGGDMTDGDAGVSVNLTSLTKQTAS